jgi:predicted alpha-1,2-mannosidase
MLKLNRYFIAGTIILASCNVEVPDEAVFRWNPAESQQALTEYVNPMIGTAGHGHTFPGATAPFGMVQLSPDTRDDDSWDGCSGYHYDDSLILGFSHTHLSGTGCSDYGDILIVPGTDGSKDILKKNKREIGSTFQHKNEKASAGYYEVTLDNGVRAELTASPRVGVHRYRFNSGEKRWIVLDLVHRDEVLDAGIEIIDPNNVSGFRRSKAWATDQELFFHATFSEAVERVDTLIDGNKIKAVFYFPDNTDELTIKVALSGVSENNARMNMLTEVGNDGFDAVLQKTRNDWNNELSKILVKGDERKKKIFYTALYHCMVAPNVYNDVNGEYRGMDHKVYKDTVHQRYTVFSLWDTYRGLHPLFTIIQQKRTNDFINTFLQQYKESGRLPVWELSSNETDCMIGYHSVSVIADAWLKGINRFDTTLAFEAMKASAMRDELGLKGYKQHGFIPAEGEAESVSKTLEYAYDDWCILQCARRMNSRGDEILFNKRSQSWKNLFDTTSKFFRARMNNGFVEPFAPEEVNFHYTEANAWQYSMAVQHDVPGLIDWHGGPKKFATHLDNLFSAPTQTSGRDQADITGLIGQYAHGNEPSHHMAYLYNYVGEGYKTQELVHEICNSLYSDQPDGLCGNEDCGQMSAWYVLSASGFYPVTPGSPYFQLGSPQFEEVIFQLENGKRFTVTCNNVNDNNPYLNSAGFANDLQISFDEIMQGKTLTLSKSNSPSQSFDPQALLKNTFPQPLPPLIEGASLRTFTGSKQIKIIPRESTDEVYYSINNQPALRYKAPFAITKDVTISCYAVNGSTTSDPAVASFYLSPGWKVAAIKNAYAPQYAAGGQHALVDGLRGTDNFRTGLWQGYEGCDIDLVIDLGKSVSAVTIEMNFLSDSRSWIFHPTEVAFALSNTATDSGNNWNKALSQNSSTPRKQSTPFIEKYSCKLPATSGRYLHVKAKSILTCPKDHPGAGKPAWLFADEITILNAQQ